MKSTEIVIHFKSIAVGYLDDQDDYYTYKHYYYVIKKFW